MITPLDSDALDLLNDDARRLVKEMLKAVVDHPTIYSNVFRVHRERDGSFGYFLGGHGQAGPFTNNQRLPINIVDTLLFHDIAAHRVNSHWPKDFHRFTDAALEWQVTRFDRCYLAKHPPGE